MCRQAQGSQTLLHRVAMRVFRADGQFRQVQTGEIEQGIVNFALSGVNPLTIAAEMLPPGIERGLAFSRCTILFIRHDDICRGELIAEVFIGHGLLVQKQARIQKTQRGAQVNPRLVNRGGQQIEDLLRVAQPGRLYQQTVRFTLAQQRVQPDLHG